MMNKRAYKLIVKQGIDLGLTEVFATCKMCGKSDFPKGDRVIDHNKSCIVGRAVKRLNK